MPMFSRLRDRAPTFQETDTSLEPTSEGSSEHTGDTFYPVDEQMSGEGLFGSGEGLFGSIAVGFAARLTGGAAISTALTGDEDPSVEASTSADVGGADIVFKFDFAFGEDFEFQGGRGAVAVSASAAFGIDLEGWNPETPYVFEFGPGAPEPELLG